MLNVPPVRPDLRLFERSTSGQAPMTPTSTLTASRIVLTDHETPTQTEPRSTAALMLKMGRLVLIEDGFGVGVDTLTFKRVFERIDAETGLKLSNASVIRRVWENQADYQADVLATIAVEDALGEFDETVKSLGPLLDSLDLSSPEAAFAIAERGVPRRRISQ